MSAEGMTSTVLATQLAEAVANDETPASGGCDLSAGMYGPSASARLRSVAEALCAAQREAAAYKWAYGMKPDLTAKTRVDRRCPRCRFHGYHDGNYMGQRNKISCVNCGHVWLGRILRRDV